MPHMRRTLAAIAGVMLACLHTSGAAEKTVLFLGDPVHQNIVNAAAKELEGRVQITSPKIRAYDSGSALAQFEQLVGGGKWDLIYFNFGVGDLFYKDPATREIRAMGKDAGGVRVSTPEQYAKNLDELCRRLSGTGAKILWGTTTPLATVDFFPSFKGNLFETDSEVEYNAIAKRVMEAHKIPIVDLHGYVMAQFGEDGTHPPYLK